MMALYKREQDQSGGRLPADHGGDPVFFALYKVLFITIEMRHAPFYGWIRTCSAQTRPILAALFGLVP